MGASNGVFLALGLVLLQGASPAPDLSGEARRLLREQRVGMLATTSVALPGYPFGSLTPYALDHEGRPLILISTLAQHTTNLKADPRVSLLVYDPGHPDVHDAPRLTWTGKAVAAPDAPSRARYLTRFPEAKRFVEGRDFALYRIEPIQGYYIGGFGRIRWVEPKDLLEAPGASRGE
jgi:heme iron utilization protein